MSSEKTASELTKYDWNLELVESFENLKLALHFIMCKIKTTLNIEELTDKNESYCAKPYLFRKRLLKIY